MFHLDGDDECASCGTDSPAEETGGGVEGGEAAASDNAGEAEGGEA